MSDKLREEFEMFSKTRTINHNMRLHPDKSYMNPAREVAWEYYKEGVNSRYQPKHETADYKELKEENTDLNISIRKVTDQRDMAIEEYADLLMDSEIIYEDLLTTGRVKCPTKKYYKEENELLSKLKDNQDGE